MRSSKSRSRSKQNRPRTLGNIVNRVFDSSGPEGKVRGTPQQIIEKYLVLARDAQLGNDRVASENFLQHAEHYIRMLAEAQRELAREQEFRGGHGNGHGGGQGDEPRERRDDGQGDQPRGVEVIDLGEPRGGENLVETPEARPERDRQGERSEERVQERRERRPQPPAPAPAEAAPAAGEPAEAEPRAARAEGEGGNRRRPRGPRRPRGGEAQGGETGGDPGAGDAPRAADLPPAEKSAAE